MLLRKGLNKSLQGRKSIALFCAGGNFKLSSFESLLISMFYLFYLITDLTESELGNSILKHVLISHLRCISIIFSIDVKCNDDNNDVNDINFLA